MQTKLFLFIFCFYVLSCANSQNILLVNPIFNEEDAILIPELEGVWNITDFHQLVSCSKVGDNFYHIQYEDGNRISRFEGVLLKIDDEIFLDLKSIVPDTLGDEYYRNSILTCHNLFKIKMLMDTILLYPLNYAWFFEYVNKDTLPIEYKWVNNAMLLTLSTDDLKIFLTEHNHDSEFFHSPLTLKKTQNAKVKKAVIHRPDSETKSIVKYPQKCIPEFPLKDGWLGGDGDASVAINDTTTLFLFSDTYVGNKNQLSRQEHGLTMIPNSVAVETCLSNGTTDIRYFWNNMYSDNPEPIFKTFTDRYKFWVSDAFIIRNNLYVILGKVGPKKGASPDDIFNFSYLGISMAKISNPFASPIEWKVELIPLNDFNDTDMGFGCHAMQDDYIYFFLNRNDNCQFLVRRHLDHFDNLEKTFEYYALDKTWKKGFNKADMDTIVNGFRCNTVNYHPDIKQWVMICDIRFLDNKIKMRTATELTGPWSDEIVIYEIPEVTPGSFLYNKSNFCYAARECIQYYNSENHVMLITYDINNVDFSEIMSNPKIYTPKVIKVSLEKRAVVNTQ